MSFWMLQKHCITIASLPMSDRATDCYPALPCLFQKKVFRMSNRMTLYLYVGPFVRSTKINKAAQVNADSNW